MCTLLVFFSRLFLSTMRGDRQPIHVKQLGVASPMSARAAVPTPARIASVRSVGLGSGAPKDDRTVSRLRPKVGCSCVYCILAL